ncbi:hypothetical protein RND81_04G015400 [Saponaria officinalis]|uniref:Syntaxin N-terminal domain-containing protein n=1 Tax=Saponaria officinalis TaxID=3572 RepID=A0AAW1LFJ5_SAPOF
MFPVQDSFELQRGQSSRDGDPEMGNLHNYGELGLQSFSKKVQEIEKQYEKINNHLRKLQDAHEESKAVTKASAMKSIKQRMEKDVDEVQKIARLIKSKIEDLDRDKPGCGKGTAIERTRTTQTVQLKKKLRDKMAEFQESNMDGKVQDSEAPTPLSVAKMSLRSLNSS